MERTGGPEGREDPVEFRPTCEWRSLRGQSVEVRHGGTLYRRGRVDATMPDSSGLWIAAEGNTPREYIDKERGFEILTTLYPRSPFHP